jgi:hypothetical protein
LATIFNSSLKVSIFSIYLLKVLNFLIQALY